MSEVEEWLNMLRCLFNGVQAEIDEASSRLWSFYTENTIQCLVNLSDTMTWDVEMSLRKMAATQLARLLRPTNKEHLLHLRNEWAAPQNAMQVSQIRNTVISLLVAEDESLRNSNFLSFALIYSLDPAGVFPDLEILLQQATRTYEFRRCAIIVFTEVLNLPYFKELCNDTTIPLYQDFFRLAQETVCHQELDLKIKCIAVNALKISIQANIFPIEMVQNLFNDLILPLQIDDETLSRELHQLLLQIVETHYDRRSEIGNVIAEITINLVSLSPSIANNNMFFWREISQYEESLLLAHSKNSKMYVPYDTTYVYNSHPSIVPVLFQRMVEIDPTDYKVEDPSDNLPSMYATIALEAMFKVCPEEIFNFISPKIEEMISSDQWVFQHSALLLLYCVVESPVEEINIKRTITDFCSRLFSRVFELTGSEIMRLKETALWVFGYVVRSYPTIIIRSQDSLQIMSSILNSFDIGKDTHPTIVLRYASILRDLAVVFKANTPRSPYKELYDTFLQIAAAVTTNETAIAENPIVIDIGYSALYEFFHNTPTSCAERNLESYLIFQKNLDSTIEMIESNNTIFRYQSGICYVLVSLAQRLKGIDPRIAEDTISLLFRILNNPNSLCYNEAMFALTMTVIHTRYHELEGNIIGQIFGLFDRVFASNDYSAISACSNSIDLMFTKLEVNFDQLAVDTYDMLYRAITSESISRREVIPDLVTSLTAVAQKLPRNEEFEGRIETIHQLALEYLNRISLLDLNNKDDLEFGNSLLVAIANCLRVFAKVFYVSGIDTTVEAQYYTELEMFSRSVGTLGVPDNNLLYAAMDLYEQYAHNCSRKNNVKLNKVVNTKICLKAKESRDKQLSERGAKIYTYMRSK